MNYDRAQLKREVKLSMKGSGCMLATLLFSVVVGVGTWLINTLLGGLLTGRLGLSTMISYHIQAGYELEEAVKQALLRLLSLGPGPLFSVVVGGIVLSFIVFLWQSSMEVGYEGWCLSMVRNERPPMGKLFSALPQILQVLVTRFLTGLFELLWSLLVMLAYGLLLVVGVALASAADSGVLAIPFVLAAVAMLVAGILWVSARYALVDYLLLDKGISGLDAIRESKRLMKGNVGRYIVLQLSFAGWYLLNMVIVYIGIALAVVPIVGMAVSGSAGGWLAAAGFAVLVAIAVAVGTTILSLWLKPYVTGAMARFYDWTQGRSDNANWGSGSGGGWGGPTDYTWSSGSSGPGTGTGSGSAGGYTPPGPKDDPWD